MKKLHMFLILLLALAIVGGCGSEKTETPPTQSAWNFKVGDKDFTIEGLKSMASTTVELDKKGEVNSYTGVLFSSVLKEAGLTEFETLVLEAVDGYSFQITKEEAMDSGSILCYAVDDKELSDNGPLMFAAKATLPQAWVGKLKIIRPGD